MERQDYMMPKLLQYENVAWYENGKVRILDRRIYPREIKFVDCRTYQEVAQAIKDMVTQSAGPYTASGMGMALASYQIAYLAEASETIATARPTTANRVRLITEKCLDIIKDALDNGTIPTEAIKQNTIDSLNRRYFMMNKVAKFLIEKIPNDGSMLW